VKSAHDCSEAASPSRSRELHRRKTRRDRRAADGPALDKYSAHAPAPRCSSAKARAASSSASPRKTPTAFSPSSPPPRSAQPPRTVGGDKLSITAHGVTLAATLAEVSDPFEHSIERAMA